MPLLELAGPGFSERFSEAAAAEEALEFFFAEKKAQKPLYEGLEPSRGVGSKIL